MLDKHAPRVVALLFAAGTAVVLLLLVLGGSSAAARMDYAARGEGERPADQTSLASATVPYTTFVDVTAGSPSTLDPHFMYDTSSSEVAMQIYETLLFYERDKVDAFVPMLAKHWSVSPDGRAYTFTIRDGVTFHAGGQLTAEDVAYSFWRGLLQDRNSGPMWMLHNPLLGVSGIDGYAGDDLAKCQAVKDAVTYDGADQTVTFHLDQPFSPFLAILSTHVGAVLDKEWMVANGAWGASCADWRDYHDPAPEDTLLFDRANGTGPFKLSRWITDEVALVRNHGYWVTEPLWDGGPAGPAALEKVLIQSVSDWETRYDMLTSGDADTVYVPRQYAAQLEPFIWELYEAPEDETPALMNTTTGTLRLYQNLPNMSSVDLFFVFDVDTSDPNPYIGSGQLDGNGIPPSFFSDLHVRKAFNYAFDWTTFISDTYAGEAIQRRGPIPAGLMGYDPTQPTYSYSPTLSAQEFQQAWGGQVWTEGFSMTIAYDTGSDQRRRACEILKQGVEAITDTFHISITHTEWSQYLNDMMTGRVPLFVSGWLQDYHHPQNWVWPYMHSSGTYASWQGFPAKLADQFDGKIERCGALTDPADAAVCYADLQNMAYENAADIFLAQPVGRHYERAEVRGWYHNAAYPGQYYYALSKGRPPTPTTIEAVTGGTGTYTSTTGLTTSVEIPGGAVSETTVIVHTPDIRVTDAPAGFSFAGRAFALEAYQDDEYVPGFAFNEPITVTLSYGEGAFVEDTLVLYTWDGTAWVDAACGPYQRDNAHNVVKVPICHLSDFALLGEPASRIYLPVVLRGS